MANHRTDEYGGNAENRTRFLLEILQEIRRQVGSDYSLLVKLSVDDLLGKYGMTIEDGIVAAKIIEPYVDAIAPASGTQEYRWTATVPYFFPHKVINLIKR